MKSLITELTPAFPAHYLYWNAVTAERDPDMLNFFDGRCRRSAEALRGRPKSLFPLAGRRGRGMSSTLLDKNLRLCKVLWD